MLYLQRLALFCWHHMRSLWVLLLNMLLEVQPAPSVQLVTQQSQDAACLHTDMHDTSSIRIQQEQGCQTPIQTNFPLYLHMAPRAFEFGSHPANQAETHKLLRSFATRATVAVATNTTLTATATVKDKQNLTNVGLQYQRHEMRGTRDNVDLRML